MVAIKETSVLCKVMCRAVYSVVEMVHVLTSGPFPEHIFKLQFFYIIRLSGECFVHFFQHIISFRCANGSVCAQVAGSLLNIAHIEVHDLHYPSTFLTFSVTFLLTNSM